MRVWRIHIKNDVAQGYTRRDLLSFCQEKKLIGVGWPDIKTREDSESAIRNEAKCYSNAAAGFKAVNTMRKMQLDDLIWTRLDGIYYLCKVTGLWKDSRPGNKHNQLDVSNYVNVKWLKIGMEDLVPGKVVSSFRPAASVQSIYDVEKISQYIWNHYSNKNEYRIKKEKLDIWTVLSDKSIEELVLLYLQVEKEFYIYSSTVKCTTREYECVMVNQQGVYCFPQVKSGLVSLNADDYMDAVERTDKAEVYLFATSEQYITNNCSKIHYLWKKDLEQFIRKNRIILPEITQSWIDLCGFFDSDESDSSLYNNVI